MRFDIITIFPEFFTGIFGNGVVKRAIANGLADPRGYIRKLRRAILGRI